MTRGWVDNENNNQSQYLTCQYIQSWESYIWIREHSISWDIRSVRLETQQAMSTVMRTQEQPFQSYFYLQVYFHMCQCLHIAFQPILAKIISLSCIERWPDIIMHAPSVPADIYMATMSDPANRDTIYARSKHASRHMWAVWAIQPTAIK